VDTDSRQGGDQTELTDKVTPAMIEAGVAALNALIGEDGSRAYADDEIVSRVLKASLQAS